MKDYNLRVGFFLSYTIFLSYSIFRCRPRIKNAKLPINLNKAVRSNAVLIPKRPKNKLPTRGEIKSVTFVRVACTFMYTILSLSGAASMVEHRILVIHPDVKKPVTTPTTFSTYRFGDNINIIGVKAIPKVEMATVVFKPLLFICLCQKVKLATIAN